MKRSARLVSAQVRGLNSKGQARLHVESHPREGLALWGPLPQEEVLVQLGSRRNVWLQEVVQPNSLRREARCLHYGPCGGCSLQHLSQDGQLLFKAARLEERLRALAPNLEIEPALASPQSYHYRTKVEFSFARDQVGFHRRGCFDRVVEVDRCWIAPPAHHQALACTRAWMKDHSLSGWDARKLSGDLRYLLIRQANPGQDWLAVLVTRCGLPFELLRDWQARLEALGASGLLWVEQSSTAGAIVPAAEHLLFGQNRLRQPLGELTFHLGWRSFFQSNPPAYQRLLDRLRAWMGEPARVLDLYCGIGSLGLYVTGPRTRLVGVESVPEAIADAQRCADELGRAASFHVGAAENWTEWDCDTAIVDPPRSGCHPGLIEKLCQVGPQQVFYVSCNPERFFSEWSRLSAHYRLGRAVVCDFFPQTAHVELLVALVRA